CLLFCFPHLSSLSSFSFFFLHDTPTTEIYTLSLHDLFRSRRQSRTEEGVVIGRAHVADVAHIRGKDFGLPTRAAEQEAALGRALDRKSTRLNSSHVKISYAVFCLKKKKRTT